MTITAKIVLDSVSPMGKRLTTMQLRYPRFVHAEFMTHRAFSRNASSSRATPVERLIKDVIDDPAMPSFWGKNQPGMQAREECEAQVLFSRYDDRLDATYVDDMTRDEAWLEARDSAITVARAFSAAGYHKQIVNRLLEPFGHINVVCTATEWDNFFALRCHEDAQPEIRLLAEAMRDAMEASTPIERVAHMPYAHHHCDAGISAARCARVSYLTHDGREPTVDEDLKLFQRLRSAVPMHASPMEHPAIAQQDPNKPCRNFRGWRQFRSILEAEA